MAIRIITDTSAEIPISCEKELGIQIMPYSIFFGEKEYISGIDIDTKQFYDLMREHEKEKKLPTTAQITPVRFEESFRPYIEAGDDIILLCISKELSGTYNCALIAKAEFPDANIHVIDTNAVTISLALLVKLAVKLRNEGCSADEIAEKMYEYRDKMRLYAVISDLKYLRLGGRLSSASAIVGTLLGIKPLIKLTDGKIVGFEKARGMKMGFQKLVDCVLEDGIDESCPFVYGHTDAEQSLADFRQFSESKFGEQLDFEEYGIGSVVGTHVGPGAVAVAFICK